MKVGSDTFHPTYSTTVVFYIFYIYIFKRYFGGGGGGRRVLPACRACQPGQVAHMLIANYLYILEADPRNCHAPKISLQTLKLKISSKVLIPVSYVLEADPPNIIQGSLCA